MTIGIEAHSKLRLRALGALLLLLAALPAALAQAAEDALVLGVFPRRNAAETTRMFKPLTDYLAERLGRKIELATTRDFESFWHGVTARRYDIVHYNQYHYIRSAQSYEVIAHIEEFGKATIAGVVYVRKDSGITRLSDLRGRTVLFGGGHDAMISYIVNRYLLQQAGLGKDDFKSLFAVNPPNSIVALQRQQADAAGAGDMVLDLPVVKKSVDAGQLVAVATSPQLLQLPVAVKRTMAPQLRASIQAILVEMKNSESGRQALKAAAMTGMGPAVDADYDPHRQIVRAVLGSTEVASQ